MISQEMRQKVSDSIRAEPDISRNFGQKGGKD